MPSFTTPNSNGESESKRGPSGGVSKTQQDQPLGEIILSHPESMALAILHSSHPTMAIKHAANETGLSIQQIQRLKARAERARQSGIALKGPSISLRHHPKSDMQPGLMNFTKRDDDEQTPVSKAHAAKTAKAAGKSGTGKPGTAAKAAPALEANSMSTYSTQVDATYLKRRKKKSRTCA